MAFSFLIQSTVSNLAREFFQIVFKCYRRQGYPVIVRANNVFPHHVPRKFSIQRKTMNLKIPYYVKENFHTEHQGSMRRLEMSVEEDYLQNLRQACYREKNYSKFE